jgi:hypothetical protein
MRRLVHATLACSLASALTARAEQWGIGAVTLPDPALSVQYGTSGTEAYHVTTHLSQERVRFSSDYQRFYVPGFGYGRGYVLGLYTGFGLGGESRRESAEEERYHLRLPVGVQCDLKSLNLQSFAEFAGLIGELPETRVSGAFTGGVRAYF